MYSTWQGKNTGKATVRSRVLGTLCGHLPCAAELLAPTEHSVRSRRAVSDGRVLHTRVPPLRQQVDFRDQLGSAHASIPAPPRHICPTIILCDRIAWAISPAWPNSQQLLAAHLQDRFLKRIIYLFGRRVTEKGPSFWWLIAETAAAAGAGPGGARSLGCCHWVSSAALPGHRQRAGSEGSS